MNAFSEIHHLLGPYFDALYFCDLEKLDQVFHPQAIYATADEQPLLYRDMPTYRKVIANRHSPASRREKRNDFIEAIEIAGNNTALARVRCSISDRHFVDLLSMVRADGQWRIISKVFHIIETKGEHHAVR